MIRPPQRHRSPDSGQFNMTPLIDVVFLLIIFFILTCQFITSENYRLLVPDSCLGAVTEETPEEDTITVSVFPHEGDLARQWYGVRARQFDPDDGSWGGDRSRMVEQMSAEISRCAGGKVEPKVYLRADRDLTWGQVQDAALALSQAGITQLQLAAFKYETPGTRGEQTTQP